MATDPEIFRHKEWLGLLQPVGLVVSPPALVKAQAVIDRTRAVEVQERLRELVCTAPIPGSTSGEEAWIEDFPAFAEQVLEWMPEDLVGASGQEALPQQLEIVLPDYGETLKPTYAVRDPDSDSWLMLIQESTPGQSLDEVDPTVEKGQGWKATVQEKFERLLRETEIPIGILDNGTHLRLVYAPRGESSGHLTFPVQAMCEVPGRLILGALDMLLGADRLFNVPIERRLPKLLSDSRDYQAEVSTKLADQVLDALWELLRGFQTADTAVNGKLLGELARTDPQHIYGGLITTLMRLVFLLYAEDQGLMPGDDVYQRNYSITGLYDRLREDAGNYPDTMDQRYGAWAWLLSLFRLVYDGGGSTPEYLPARHGQLFDPDEYPFLEGRSHPHPLTPSPLMGEGEQEQDTPLSQNGRGGQGGEGQIPRIPDGVIYRLLEKLLVLDGERLSYRALDVEQIGSVYEAIMGFEVEVAQGLSIAVRPKDVVVNVEDILKALPKDREKLLQEVDCKLTGKALSALKEAKTPEEVVAALERRVSLSRTPNLLPVGSLYLQPGEERRRTGSHYTPRKLTQPIVETTLRPVLEALGKHPSADQILSLKVCDLAMGSGAFLVEACRQLGEQVMEAWDYHGDLSNYLPATHPHPPTPSPSKGEGEKKNHPSPLVGEGQGVRGTTGNHPQVEGEPAYWDVPETLKERMKEVARQFRKKPTSSEAILWQALRGRKLEGCKFRRQQPIGTFIVDFFCPSERLIVEVDGLIHESQQDLDIQRQELLESLGLRFVRIKSSLVENDLSCALDIIRNALLPSPPQPPSPILGEEGESLTSISLNETAVRSKEGESSLVPLSPGGRGVRGEGDKPNAITTAAEPLLLARRLVAQRCLYGVDKNPFAVNLAKLSLWLVTLAKDRPFTFLDHALKCGDSLVGLTRAEIGSFGKDPLDDLPLLKLIKEKVDRAKSYRTEIQALDTRTDQDAEDKLARLKQAEQELEDARLTGDVAVAAFFDSAGKSKKEREEIQESYSSLVREWRQSYIQNYEHNNPEIKLKAISDRIRSAKKSITPFNWEIEFPEVFDRENSGFDAIVGNPPFAGSVLLASSLGSSYAEYLRQTYVGTGGKCDLVAFFFRKAFILLRQKGCMGLVATNTISQGDTRESSLSFLLEEKNGDIYSVQKRIKWPGKAAVVVAVVYLSKGEILKIKHLNDKPLERITAFLLTQGGNRLPPKFIKNSNIAFLGNKPGGRGYIFEKAPHPDANDINSLEEFLNEDTQGVIKPYLGCTDVMQNVLQSPSRWIVDFGDFDDEENTKATFGNLYKMLLIKVQPKVNPTKWWQFSRCAKELRSVLKANLLKQVLVIGESTDTFAFSFQSPGIVFSNSLVIICLDSYAAFCILQSRIHENWKRIFSSTFKDDSRYVPADCFETFPFPENWETEPTLETVGKEYYEFRADLMVRNNQGLTDTYNRFHDRDERDPDILKLRELHTKMDRAVLDAYGWTDIPTTCEFLLDYEEEEDESNSRRKKPWRYRWSEEIHDEVLARLLDLNQKRHEAEILGGKHAETKAKSKKSRKPKATKSTPTNVQQPSLFGE